MRLIATDAADVPSLMGFTFLKMMFLIASVCTSSLCLAAPETYDVMVVGAGSAGVAAALRRGAPAHRRCLWNVGPRSAET